MLNFDHICLSLPSPQGNKCLIDNASAQILAGQSVMLTGSSGSGKSLLLKIIASLLAFDSGILTWQNQSITDLSPQRWRAEIGFIQQMPVLIEGTVIDNLTLPYEFKFYQHQHFDLAWHEQALHNLGKPLDFLTADTANLSGGERQLVNLLRCLQLQPTLLLLDEPTAALDSSTTQQVEHLVTHWQAAQPERSWLWVTHDTNQLQRLTSQFINMQHWQMQQGVLRC